MTDQKTRVCEIIPAYNNVDYTIETVESVLPQTYRDFEVIVVDDGSTDHARDVLCDYEDLIHYIYEKNGELVAL
jgi:glycosyltransferase involved in cell wall biosynthesis